MSTVYDVFLRNKETGLRTKLIQGIVSLSVIFRFNEPSKWVITGAGLEECPVSGSSDIAVFRNNSILFCGYTESVKTKFDVKSQIYDWEISGKSDLGKISYRLIYPDSSVATPNPNQTYSDSGVLSAVMSNLIKKNAAQSSSCNVYRRLPNLTVPTQTSVGDSVTIEAKLENVVKYIQDNLKSTDIQIKETWDMETGEWDIYIGNPQDVSSSVIFSVDNGSIAAWERTVSAPKANHIVVTGCKNESDELMYVSVYDQDSIDKWGRIESTVNRSDIKRNEDTSETWESVAARLENAAYEELEKATATFGYKLTVSEMSKKKFPEDYGVGSIVSVRIGNDEFTAKVEEIKITYAKGVETIVPSVGTMQKGELQKVFTEIGTLKEQVKVLSMAS